MKKPVTIKKNYGLTMIELVLAMVVFSIIGSVMTQMVSRSGIAYSTTKENISDLSELRYAFKRLEKEIRHIDYNAGTYNIDWWTTTNVLSFTKLDGKLVTLTYTPASNLLELSYDVPLATGTLLDNVNSFTTSFLKFDGTAATDGTDVGFVLLNTTINIGNSTQSLSTRIALRDKI